MKELIDWRRVDLCFFTGENVSIHHPDFEFYMNGKPTGEYARGKIINRNGNEYSVKLYCNGDVYPIIDKYLVIKYQ